MPVVNILSAFNNNNDDDDDNNNNNNYYYYDFKVAVSINLASVHTIFDRFKI